MSPPPTFVTGFEPFGGETVNTSQLVAEAVERRQLEGIGTAVLPTSYTRSADRLDELVESHRPAVLLMLGLAEDATLLTLERRALNLDDADASDNDGEVRKGRRILDDAPDSYRTSLDLDAMARTARRLGEEIVFSDDAGGFVCNHAFFTAAHLAATSEAPGMRYGFVHLPPVAGSGDRLTRLVDVVTAWLAPER